MSELAGERILGTSGEVHGILTHHLIRLLKAVPGPNWPAHSEVAKQVRQAIRVGE